MKRSAVCLTLLYLLLALPVWAAGETAQIGGQSFVVVQQSPLAQVTTDPAEVNQLVIEGYQTVGLVAHRDLAGAAFYSLREGSVVPVAGVRYEITRVTVTGSAFGMSRRFFRQKDKIVLITCTTVNGDPVGGRRVVMGVRLP